MDKLDLILQTMKSMDDKLGKMDTRFGCVETRLGNVEMRLDSMETRLGSVETRLDAVETRQERMHAELVLTKEELGGKIDEVRLELENHVYPAINIIGEQHLDLYRKLQEASELKPTQDMLVIRVTALEYSMGRVREDLEKLKTA